MHVGTESRNHIKRCLIRQKRHRTFLYFKEKNDVLQTNPLLNRMFSYSTSQNIDLVRTYSLSSLKHQQTLFFILCARNFEYLFSSHSVFDCRTADSTSFSGVYRFLHINIEKYESMVHHYQCYILKRSIV